MSIKITSDRTCDLSRELLERYDITLIPLSVIMDGKPFRDGEEIVPADIFSHVERGGSLCSTSAVNTDDYRAISPSAPFFPHAIRTRPSPLLIIKTCMWWTA